jgi:hypothetical protein
LRPCTSRTLLIVIGTSISSRVSRTPRVLPVEGRSTPIFTVVPALPLILAVATSESSPAIDSPLTETITSPTRMPAPWAGVPGSTRATRSPFLTSLTVSPTPEKLPVIDSLKRFRSSGLK